MNSGLAVRFLLFVVFLSLIGCKSKKEKELEGLAQKIESTDIERYRNIEYMLVDSLEKYSYLSDNKLFSSWMYDRRAKRFRGIDEQKLKTIIANPESYIYDLRNKIQAINVLAVSKGINGQTKFWIADNEYIFYIYQQKESIENPILKEELKTAQKIQSGWFFTRLKVCRNR